MKAITERRPIAVTISNYDKDGSEVGREKLGFNAAEEVKTEAPTVAKALVSVGFVPESKAESYAMAISEFITKERDEIRIALEKIQ